MKFSIILIYIVLMTACSQRMITPDTYLDKPPTLFPDYTDVTFPVNIAPPNFQITEDGEEYYTEIGFKDKVFFTLKSKECKIVIPLKQWYKLTSAAVENDFYIRVSIRQKDKWIQRYPKLHFLRTDRFVFSIPPLISRLRIMESNGYLPTGSFLLRGNSDY